MTIQLPEIVKKAKAQILVEWMKQQIEAVGMRGDLIKEAELQAQSGDFLNHFQKGAESGEFANIKAEAWAPTLELLDSVSRQRERMGFSPSETALFVFSLKEPLSAQL
eukprot:gene7293-9041_t